MARSDIRLLIGFHDHPKTQKLQRRLGSDGVLSLQRLWCWAAVNKPKGNLGASEENIEIAAGWKGNPDEFVKACVEVGFIDKTPSGYELHDWEEHQPWVFGSAERSEHARKAAKARHDRKRRADNVEKCGVQNRECSPHCIEQENHAQCNAPSPLPSPLPSPIPSPTPTIAKGRSQGSAVLGEKDAPAAATRPISEKQISGNDTTQDPAVQWAIDTLESRMRNEPMQHMRWRNLSDSDKTYQLKAYKTALVVGKVPAGFPPPPDDRTPQPRSGVAAKAQERRGPTEPVTKPARMAML